MKSSLPKMTLIIILIIALSVVITTVSFTVFYAMISQSGEEPASDPYGSGMTSTHYYEDVVRLEYDLGPIRTDLADKRYVQVNVVLLYPEIKQKIWFGLREEVDETLPKALETQHRQIKEVITNALRNLSSTALRGDALEKVKSNLIEQINKLLPARDNDHGVIGVLFEDIVVTT